MSREDFLNSIKVNNKNGRNYKSKKFDFDKLKKVVQRGIAVGLVSLTIAGFTGCTQGKEEQATPVPSTSQTTSIDPYENLNTYDGMLNDFKENYVKAYNEEHGTEYAASELEISISHPDYLYKTADNQYVTHGSYPYETERILEEYGDFSKVDSQFDIDLYQILLKYDNKVLESYAQFFNRDGDYIETPVHSGNDLSNLEYNLENNSVSTFKDFVSACEALDKNQKSKYIEAMYPDEIVNEKE